MYEILVSFGGDKIENNTWTCGDMEFIFECSHDDGVFDDFLKISDHFPKISEDFPKLFRTLDERLRTFSEHFPKITEDC